MISIRRNLLLALLGVIIIAMLIAGRATYVAARDEAGALFDYHLQQIALSLRDQTFSRSTEALVNDEGLDYVIRIFDRNGGSVYYSKPNQVIPDIIQLGYSNPRTPSGEWRVFAIQHQGITIAVAQPVKVRERLAAAAAWRTLMPFILLLPFLGGLIWYLVGYGLRPMTHLAEMVKKRSPDSLEPLHDKNVPVELNSLVNSLNDLLARLKNSQEMQKAFLADAAHELRTPLTALRLQTQLVERALTEEERKEALDELKNGIHRATHLVEQLLVLARQEPEAVEYDWKEVKLSDLICQVVTEQSHLADSKGIDLGVDRVDDLATVQGDYNSLHQLLTNLVGNALRYTPRGGIVDVSCGVADQFAWLKVSDNGPGIPQEEWERVFNRFYRLNSSDLSSSGNSAEAGSGLGLAIVKMIAERHKAKVFLGDSPTGGLTVLVDFKQAA